MLRLILLILGTSAFCVWLSGCLFGGPPPDYRGDLNTDIYLAHNIEGSISLTYGSELANRPSSILEMSTSKSSNLTWRDQATDLVGMSFKLRGTKLGTHELMIRYRDDDGRKRKQKFRVHVVEHDHSRERVSCDESVDGPPYFVAPGAEFRVSAAGFDADNNLLPLGDLDLIADTDGFQEGEDWRTWVAPDKPGTYTWSLAGKEEREFDIIVYDPADLVPNVTVATRDVTEQPKLVVDLGPALKDDAGFACIKPARARVEVEVVDGECLPVLGSLAFEDGLSVDLSGGPRSLGIVGEGSCTVRVTSPHGENVEETLNADVLPSGLDAPAVIYHKLGPGPIEVVAPPEDSIVADRIWSECRLYSAHLKDNGCPEFYLSAYERSGCFSKAEWTTEYADLDSDIDYAAVGVGLIGELTLRLDAKGGDSRVDGLDMQPTGLTFAPDFDGLAWTGLGCTETRRIVQFHATAPQHYELTVDAANATAPKEIIIRAHDIAQTTLNLTDAVVETDADEYVGPYVDPEATTLPPSVRLHDGASTQHWFVGQAHTAELTYYNDEGEPLRGVGSIVVSSSEEDSEAGVHPSTDHREFGVFAGTRRNLLEVGSPHAPTAHRIFAEDETGIAGIFGLDVVRLAEETSYCVELHALSEDGLLILGTAPAPPRVRGTREKLMVSVSDDDVPRACFRGHTEGDAELTWSWGEAEQNVTWTVE